MLIRGNRNMRIHPQDFTLPEWTRRQHQNLIIFKTLFLHNDIE
jgi:hypothetical protein